MKPRDISLSQLWSESSMSSLGSLFDESSDEEDMDVAKGRRHRKPVQAALPRVTKSKRQPRQQNELPRRSTFHNGCHQRAAAEAPPTEQTQDTLKSLQRMGRGRRTNTAAVQSRSPRDRPVPKAKPGRQAGVDEPICLSPMRKFRSNISDSGLSFSRSYHQTQRLRAASQANAKWDGGRNAHGNIFQRIVDKAATGQSDNRTEVYSRNGCGEENDSAIGSRATSTRWSSSSHTGDVVLRPCRQKCGWSANSCSDDEAEPEDTNDVATTESSNTKAQIGAFLARHSTNTRPQIPHRQRSFRSRFPMEDAIQEAMAVDDFSEDGEGLSLQAAFVPLQIMPRRPTGESLICLMNAYPCAQIAGPGNHNELIKSASRA